MLVPTSAQASAAARSRGRDGPRRRSARRDPTATWARQPRNHERPPPRLDSSEIISTVHQRRSPTISATAGLQMTGYVEGRPGRTGPRWPTRGRTSAGELADAAERFCETCFAVGAVLRAALLRNELFPSGASLTRRRYHGCCSFRGLRAPLAARLRVRRSASRAGPTVCQPVCERCRLVPHCWSIGTVPRAARCAGHGSSERNPIPKAILTPPCGQGWRAASSPARTTRSDR